MPPKTRHEHVPRFVAGAVKVNMDLHETFHKDAQCQQTSSQLKALLFLLALEAVYMVPSICCSIFPLINHYLFNVRLDVTLYSYFYTF